MSDDMLMFPVTLRNTRSLVVVLKAGLEDDFAEVQVSVVDCPDLTQEPFKFPAKGKTFSAAHPPFTHPKYLHTDS